MASPKSADILADDWHNSLALLHAGWRRFLTTNRHVWVKVGMSGIYAACWLEHSVLIAAWQADA